MLGEKIGEEQGKVTSRRVLPGDDYRYVKMEITFETQGTICGVEGTNIGTYVAFERVPGQIYGEGRGIFMTNTGQGAIWNAMGVGRGGEDGITFAVSVAFQAPTEGPLARLNGVLVVAEHNTNFSDEAKSTLYEWKA